MQTGLLANLSGSLDRLKATVDHAFPAVRCAPSQSVCCPADRRHTASGNSRHDHNAVETVGHASCTTTYHLQSAAPCSRPCIVQSRALLMDAACPPTTPAPSQTPLSLPVQNA